MVTVSRDMLVMARQEKMVVKMIMVPSVYTVIIVKRCNNLYRECLDFIGSGFSKILIAFDRLSK